MWELDSLLHWRPGHPKISITFPAHLSCLVLFWTTQFKSWRLKLGKNQMSHTKTNYLFMLCVGFFFQAVSCVWEKSTSCGCFDVSECEQLYLCLCVCTHQRGHSTLKGLRYFHLQALRCSRHTEEARGKDKERHFTHDEHFETDLIFTSCPVCTLPQVELLGFLTLHKTCPLCSTVSNNNPKGQAQTAISFPKPEPISAFRGNVFFFFRGWKSSSQDLLG